MSGLYAGDGSINVTVVAGTVTTGLYAADGSYNVVISPGGQAGLYNKCGAYNVTAATGTQTGYYATDGSMNIYQTLGLNHNTQPGTPVTVVAGTNPFNTTQANAFLARTSGSSNTQKIAWSNFINSGVTDGWFQKLDVIHLYAADIQANSNLNLVSSSFTAVPTTSPTWTTRAGYNPVAATLSYIDHGFNPATAGGQYTQNAATVGLVLLETGGTGSNYSGGLDNATDSTQGVDIYANFSGSIFIRVNDSTPQSSAIATGATSSTGFFAGVRTGATAVSGYKNGSLIGTNAQTSAPLFSVNMESGVGNGGALSAAYDGQVRAFLAGGILTGTDISNLNTRLVTYFAAI